MRSQRTIKEEIHFDGFGIHTGKFCRVTLRPAPIDNGIIFNRIDKNLTIHAHIKSVLDTSFAITIGKNEDKIRTVEHLLSTLSGLCIDNIILDVEGEEIPVLDGSAIKLVHLILNAGILKQSKKMPYIKITQPIFLEDKSSSISVYPHNGRKITSTIKFENHFLGEQRFSIDLDEDSFIKKIAPARTFGFLKDVEFLRSNGFAKGGSLKNAVVFSETSVLNKSGMRFDDECIRHKILDIIGDFSLVGLPIYGHIISDRSGHSTNINFLNKLLLNTDCWEVVTERVKSTSPFFNYSYV